MFCLFNSSVYFGQNSSGEPFWVVGLPLHPGFGGCHIKPAYSAPRGVKITASLLCDEN